MRFVVAAILVISCTVTCWGEPPVLDRLFPTGARRGTTIDVSVKGRLSSGKAEQGKAEQGKAEQGNAEQGKVEAESKAVWCSHPGVVWTKGDQADQLRVAVAADATAEVAYVRLINADGVSAVKPFLVGQVPECVELEPNDLVGQAMGLGQLPQLVHGVLDKRGDVDQVRVALRAGETLVASVRAERDLRSDVDATLQVVDEQGNVLAQNLDYHGLDPQIVWQADHDRSVIVRVFGFPADPNSTIALGGGDNYLYQLTVTTGPWCEGAMPLAVSSTQATAVKMVGWNLDNALLTQVVRPQTLDANASGGASYSFWTDGVPGHYELPVTQARIWSLTTMGGEQGDASNQIPTKIELPAVVCGNISHLGQRDAVEFSAVKDTQWTFELESRKLGYPLDGVLAIEQVIPAESGQSVTTKLLVEVDDVGQQADSEIHWTVPSDGSYLVTIRDVNGAAVANNLYRLTIREQQPDYRVTVAETLYTGKAGETLEIPINIERKFGYDRTLSISLDGDFAELQAEPVISEAGGETSKEVKLRLTAGHPQITRFRLTVNAVSEPGESQPAKRIITDVRYGIEDLWLVVR